MSLDCGVNPEKTNNNTEKTFRLRTERPPGTEGTLILHIRDYNVHVFEFFVIITVLLFQLNIFASKLLYAKIYKEIKKLLHFSFIICGVYSQSN